jgi:hypothetical protein
MLAAATSRPGAGAGLDVPNVSSSGIAKAPGLEVPPTLTAGADEVIA